MRFYIPILCILLSAQPVSSFNFVQNQSDQDVLAKRDSGYLIELNQKAQNFLEDGKPDSASAFIQEAFQLAKFLGEVEGEAFAANLAQYYDLKGLPDSVLTTVAPLLERYQNTSSYIDVANLIAISHGYVGNFQQSLGLFKETLEVAKQQNDIEMQMGITQNMGNSYYSVGDIPSAIDSFLSSLEMAEEQNDTLVIEAALANLGMMNNQEGNYELAEEYLLKALNLSIETKNLFTQATIHINIGILHHNLEKFDLARQHYERVLELSDRVGIVFSKMQAFCNLGHLYTDMGNTDQALEFFQESLQLCRENNLPIGYLYNYTGMGNLYSDLAEFDQAIYYYQQALQVAERLHANDNIKDGLLKLFETAENAGDTSLAYTYLKRYSDLRDSLSTTEREEALARQETVLNLRSERDRSELLEETVATQRTQNLIISVLGAILLLASIWLIILYRRQQKANELLKAKQKEVEDANNVKDQLLSVLSHDLRTPIAGIQGVIYLIREKLLEKEDIEDALSHIDSQLQQGINTLTNYLEWAQNHRQQITADLTDLSLREPIQKALQEIKKSADHKEVDVLNTISPDLMVHADSHMMNVILRNLLSNAVKFVDSGDSITISANVNEDSIELSVKDTGQGIPPEKLETLFVPFKSISRGTKGEIGTGLGLSICKEFAEKQGGSIHCESEVGAGTTFTVSLQKSNKTVKAEATV